jgi:hypothetical protein
MVRMMKQNNGGKLTRPINIELRGGTYWLLEPFELTAEDSGTVEFPVTYSAYEGEKPILSAGRAIRDWGKAKLNGYDVWAANVSQFKDAVNPFHELWVNGQRRTLARSPNKGYFLAGAVPDLKPKTSLGQGQTNFHYLNDDLKNWPGVADADVVLNTSGPSRTCRCSQSTKKSVWSRLPRPRFTRWLPKTATLSKERPSSLMNPANGTWIARRRRSITSR